jgi:hypothetical protein
MNNIWNSFTNTFNNREVSLIIWLLVVLVIVLVKERLGFLKTCWGFVMNLFDKTILIIQLTFWAYLIGVISLLKLLGLWNMGMMKDAVIFLLITAFMMVLKIATDKNRRRSLTEVFKDAVKPIIFAEFIMNLESLSLIGEIILLPVMLVLYFGVYTNKDKIGQENAAKGFNFLFTLVSVYLLYHGINYLYTNFASIDKHQTIRDFLFPVLTTLAFLPYLYGTIQFMKWEDEKVQKRIKGMYK